MSKSLDLLLTRCPSLGQNWMSGILRSDLKDLASHLESTALEEADIIGDPEDYDLGDSDAAVEELIADIARRTAEQTDVQEEEWIAGMAEGDDDNLADVGEDGDGDGDDEEEEEEDVEFDENAAIEH